MILVQIIHNFPSKANVGGKIKTELYVNVMMVQGILELLQCHLSHTVPFEVSAEH
jgi:hypothetical protein